MSQDARKRGYPCLKGCGRYIVGPTGVCSPCRTTPCKKCGRKLRQQYEGQALHTKCKPVEARGVV